MPSPSVGHASQTVLQVRPDHLGVSRLFGSGHVAGLPQR